MSTSTDHDSLRSVAVVGMAGRFPKARNLDQFWKNLHDGVECVSFFSGEELVEAGVDPELVNNPNYVKAASVLEDRELFDAAFFDYTPREAEVTDPQRRIFLECAWEALENAGYDPARYDGSIAVYAGTSMNTYLYANLYPNRELVKAVGGYQLMIANDKDFLGTNASYKFNLTGPSIDIQTACSTSLVAICQACQSLLGYQCDMVLAGGVSITNLRKAGYYYQQGGIASPDGHCRAFDARARGTVGGDGVGVVVLKRLSDAVADGDCIHAVIKGSALNNDGSVKIGFTAPSIRGQAEVIAMAQAVAGVEPETISYIEAHGTGTELGDPVEVAALTRAFRARTDKKGFCAIGSVKTNIGHLDAAAGVAGFLKTVLALEHKEIPPSLHFERPNPKIDFDESPFYVNARLSPWKSDGCPRRAGISAFGIGGTNAHVVVEEAPALTRSGDSRPWQLLPLSAKTETALEAMTSNLVEHFAKHPRLNLADAAYTLQVGRGEFPHRRMAVCRDLADAVETLRARDPKRVFTACHEPGKRAVAFMFSGQGAQYVGMGRDLYDTEPRFREVVDQSCALLRPHLGCDLRGVLYPDDEAAGEAARTLTQTRLAQPALFVIESALARLWMSWGIEPQAMIGHSIGEYVAACLAGVFSLEDGLALVAGRGRLMQQQPPGTMLAVWLPAAELRSLIGEPVSLAAINGPSLCVVSGPAGGINAFEKKLQTKGVRCRPLHTSHAFHSEMMDDVLEPFAELAARVTFSPPKIPYLSNVTGTWITPQQATDPDYWARHLRGTVCFADGVRELLKEPSRILLEVGPGRTLSTLAGSCLRAMESPREDQAAAPLALASMRHPEVRQSDAVTLLNTLGQLWLSGIGVDWSEFHTPESRRRVPLPTYPFDRQRYWVEPRAPRDAGAGPRPAAAGKRPAIADWFYVPVWKQCAGARRLEPVDPQGADACCLVFLDPCGLGNRLVEKLKPAVANVITVAPGKEFAAARDGSYTLNAANREHYDALIEDLAARDAAPARIIHLWTVSPDQEGESVAEDSASRRDLGFYSLLFLAQALGKQKITAPVEIMVVSSAMQEVTGTEPLCPEKATLLGPCKVIPQEHPNITCRSVDIALPAPGSAQEQKLIDQLAQEVTAKPSDFVAAYRGGYRWVQTFEAVRLESGKDAQTPIREGGVYLITGGLGRIGFTLAEYLAQSARPKLVLLGRSGLPDRDQWRNWLESHPQTDVTSLKIRRIQALEQKGADVMVARADVSHPEQMRDVVDRVNKRFGAIHGVIHAAGQLEGASFKPVQDVVRSDCESQFRPKVDGLAVLSEALAGQPFDFCILLSSLSSVLGGLGFVAYAAANLFMDAFAHRMARRTHVPWISVNWDAWDFSEGTRREPDRGPTLADLALRPDEGVEALQRILAVDPPVQVVVSTGDLEARIRKWIHLESLRDKKTSRRDEPSPSRARPNLRNAYVAPGNEVENTIAQAWQESFGIDQIGIHDNFFELGGHSLQATGLMSQVRDTFQVEISLQRFFEKPTIAELAETVLQTLVEQQDDEALSRILTEIEEETGKGV